MKLRLHLATANRHKVGELAALADRYPPRPDLAVEVVASATMPAVTEDTGTLEGNALKKARALRAVLPPEAWVLADDSGVSVDALDGGPGVESAYFAGPQGDPGANLRKLVEVMKGVPVGRRGAHFLCVLVLLGPGGEPQVFEGRCNGTLAEEPLGGGGFGYDPLFIPAGHACTYAQLGEAEKNRISHRARAWMKLATWLAGAGVGVES